MKTFVIGDIHGACQALLQCLQRADFDPHRDHLIVLGDVCDGYPQVKECIDELLKIKNLTYVIGNHDLWALGWAGRGSKEEIWLSQGGRATVASYGGEKMPQAHVDFLKNAPPWYAEHQRLFVHGGFDPLQPIEEQSLEFLVWDRELLHDAHEKAMQDPDFRFSGCGGYEEIFIGHTPTQNFGSDEPLHLCNLWALDTGAGWSGKLTIMDVATKEFWQSDPTPQLYPGKGRG